MLNREKIIEILNEYNFDCDKYVVLSVLQWFYFE